MQWASAERENHGGSEALRRRLGDHGSLVIDAQRTPGLTRQTERQSLTEHMELTEGIDVRGTTLIRTHPRFRNRIPPPAAPQYYKHSFSCCLEKILVMRHRSVWLYLLPWPRVRR